MSLTVFYNEMKKGFKAPAYLLHAEDPYLLKEALFAVRRTVPDEEWDFLFHSFDLENSDSSLPVEQIIDVLNTVSLMGGRKVVAIENVQKLLKAGLEPLAKYLENPSPDALLVMLYAGKVKKTTQAALGAAKQIGIDIRERDIPAWLAKRAEKKGIKLSREAAEYLIGTVGADAGLLASEVEKLAMLGKPEISAQDVVEIVRGEGDYTAWDLIDALKAGDPERVFHVYEVLSRSQEAYALLGALNWHFTRRGGTPKEKARIFALLSEADLKVRSGAYPMEYLLVKLLRA
jgi:DNA polymerase III delta subunit